MTTYNIIISTHPDNLAKIREMLKILTDSNPKIEQIRSQPNATRHHDSSFEGGLIEQFIVPAPEIQEGRCEYQSTSEILNSLAERANIDPKRISLHNLGRALQMCDYYPKAIRLKQPYETKSIVKRVYKIQYL